MTKTQKKFRDEIAAHIDGSDEWAVGMLLHLYQFQTHDEQVHHATIEKNDIGFNGADGGILTSISEFYNTRGFVTPKQMSFVKKALKKYWRQVGDPAAIKPRTIKKLKKNASQKPKRIGFWAEYDAVKNRIIIDWAFERTKDGKEAWHKVHQFVKGHVQRARWDKEKKSWHAPLTAINITRLHWFGFDLDPELMAFWFTECNLKDPEPIIPIAMKKPNGDELHPFQQLGIGYIESRNGNALIGDEMGLGKTLQALGYACYIPELRPVVVSCPASVKEKWCREIRRWTHMEPIMISGQKPHALPKAEIYVINHDILTYWEDELQRLGIAILILDEVHYFKNKKALRTKAVMTIANPKPDDGKPVTSIIGLSGTPIENRPIEFWQFIELAKPQLFTGFWDFAQRYCGAKNNGYGWDFNGASNTKELHEIITKYLMIRRKKTEVNPELPAKQNAVVPLEIDNRAEYESVVGQVEARLRDLLREKLKGVTDPDEYRYIIDHHGNAQTIMEYGLALKTAMTGKIAAVEGWIKDFMDSTDEKLIIFGHHKEIVKGVAETFKSTAVCIDGSTPQGKRQTLVDQFQNDPKTRLIVCSEAAREGLDMTAASNVAFIELWWKPAWHDQASDRCYGRMNDPHGATVWWLVAGGTIEETMCELIDHKRRVLDAVLDGKDTDERSLLALMLEKTMGGE